MREQPSHCRRIVGHLGLRQLARTLRSLGLFKLYLRSLYIQKVDGAR